MLESAHTGRSVLRPWHCKNDLSSCDSTALVKQSGTEVPHSKKKCFRDMGRLRENKRGAVQLFDLGS